MTASPALAPTVAPPAPATATADGVLAALDAEQRQVATALRGPVCVLAGAGTGKTRAITHRIAYGVHAGVYVPQHVLAVTFTARAAGEMRVRLRDLGVAAVPARTFHAAALKQLSFFWPSVIGGAPPQVVDHKSRLLTEAAARLRLSLDRVAVRDVAAEVEWAKVNMLTAASYPAAAARARRGEAGGCDAASIARLLEVYEDVKTEQSVIDFEDVLLLTVGILEENPQVLQKVQQQYRYFVVDEYQDVNAVQQRLLNVWLGERDDLCVVGDPRQTIYSFTGATPRYLESFRSKYPQAQVVSLVRDYRSTPQVVGLANALVDRPRTGLGSDRRAEQLRLVAQREQGPRPVLQSYPDDVAEAAGIAQRIKSLVAQGVSPDQIAVLYRTNAQSQPVEQALSDVGVPYLVRGGERFFARKEVRDAIMLLRGAARSTAADSVEPVAASDNSAGSAALSDVRHGTGSDAGRDAEPGAEPGAGSDTDRGAPAGEAAASSMLAVQVGDILASLGWSTTAPESVGAVRDRWESLQALVSLAQSLATANPSATLADLVAELEDRAANSHAPTVAGVTLASLHAAKGLEWEAVFLIGLSEGLLPIALAQGWEAVEEERRLLYVGITRAHTHLHLSWTKSRTGSGRATRSVSRFLDTATVAKALGLPDAPSRIAASDPAGSKPRSRRTVTLPATCRSCGSQLTTAAQRKTGRCEDCPPSYDEEVFQRLRTWRSEEAKAAKLPAYCVFTDATLTAIAETMPTDTAALATIPGLGTTKLEKYGPQVLELLKSELPAAR